MNGQTLGKGLSAYSAADIRSIMGQKSKKIEELLGFHGRSEVIHRDDLAMGS
jgi:glutamate 5-kinase